MHSFRPPSWQIVSDRRGAYQLLSPYCLAAAGRLRLHTWLKCLRSLHMPREQNLTAHLRSSLTEIHSDASSNRGTHRLVLHCDSRRPAVRGTLLVRRTIPQQRTRRRVGGGPHTQVRLVRDPGRRVGYAKRTRTGTVDGEGSRDLIRLLTGQA